MQEQALQIASHITHPVTIVAIALVFAASAFRIAHRARKPRIAWTLALGIILLGLAPLVASTFVQSRGVYRVRVVVSGPGQLPVDGAHVSSSIGGEPKKVESGWEFDIPTQIRPTDGKVVLFASLKNAFLSGSSTLFLARDYYPTTTIQLTSDSSAVVRGVVVDEHRRSVAGATVSIAGYQDSARTDIMGNFVLPAHAAEGQIVQVRAQKDQLVGSISVPAGNVPIELVIKRQ
jgi:hypothetical protein